MLNSEGKLRIRAFTAGGALPIAGARVKISGAEEQNQSINYLLTTDRDGTTATVTLPAPDVIFSQHPSPSESPYSIYDVEISAEGYNTKVIKGLPVFAGIESYQGINMIPLSRDNSPNGSNEITIPENNLNF